MEMEYKDTSRRGKVLVVLGVVLAVAAGAGAFLLVSQAQERAGQGTLQLVSVVVAAQDIPARKPIEVDDVEVRDVPIDATNAQGTAATPDVVLGRVPAVTILQGQMVTTNLLASSTEGGQFSILEPNETVTPDSEAWRAVSITATDDRAVGGLLQPNQVVDVFVTATVLVPQSLLDEGELYTDKSTKITYQSMVILARSGTFYVLKAPLAIAEEISHLQASGTAQFSLVLRPEQDVRVADASALGATTNMLVKRYGLPIPEVFPPGSGPIPIPEPLPTPTPEPTEAPEDGDPDATASPAP
ncbi:MAG TPA: RcpC/CpaB family pilus assembly protein [Vitreimonas sp.]|nr:RcpC/CpaB family pilus assembly protein [Vitreimonas sp.]